MEKTDRAAFTGLNRLVLRLNQGEWLREVITDVVYIADLRLLRMWETGSSRQCTVIIKKMDDRKRAMLPYDY